MELITLIVIFASTTFAQVEPDWSSTATIDAMNAPKGRENIYQWPEQTWAKKINAGKLHALNYPLTETPLLMPARTTLRILDSKPGDPLFKFLKTLLSLSSDFKDFKGFWQWLGLNDYPTDGSIPYPNGVKPDYPMGVSLIQRGEAQGFTLSCAACHTSNLFGKPIMGMTNRFARANEFFLLGKKAAGAVPQSVFAVLTGASSEERRMYHETQKHIVSIAVRKPQALGLDTSLSQVALSLAKRSQDPWALRNSENARHPRPNLLDTLIADSKPAVWWNAKYKTRWLSDGSVVSGNPVFTNFLWNEIGRGVDLEPLVGWLQSNSAIVQELTTAVFASKAPKYRDFFGESSISIERAKRGEKLFNQSCIQCHGQYQKAWSLPAHELAVQKTAEPELSLLDSVALKYPDRTPIRDVGTDDGRRKGMKALAEALNPLAFSQKFAIVIEEQKGYVPPPLDGIWARYPYFHNNSIPNLCALMTSPTERPAQYYSGQAINKDRDYDQECLGYPTGSRTPAEWKKNSDYLYDTRKTGMGNQGHYEKIFTANGVEKFSVEQKKDLIEYLKTL